MATTTLLSGNALSGAPLGIDGMGTEQILSGLQIQHFGAPGSHIRTEFSFRNFPLAITTALAYSSQLLYTFPRGKILVSYATSHMQFTTTSDIAATLNSGVAVSYGFGTAAASSLTLATTMQNFLPGTGIAVATFTSSTTINVASAAVTHDKGSTPIMLDGSSTALPFYFNLGVAAASVDADATLTVNGRVSVLWTNMGGWQYYTNP